MEETIEMRLKILEARVHALEEGRTANGLIDRYGESVNKTVAAKILGVARETVYAMIKDGRIYTACEGRRVSVQSIARYIAAVK